MVVIFTFGTTLNSTMLVLFRALLVLLVLKAHRVFKVKPVQLVLMAPRVFRAFKARLVLRAKLVHKAFKVFKVT